VTGYFIYGFDECATEVSNQVNTTEKEVLVMGAEGKGLHELVKKNCDVLLRIPMVGKIASLNVSVATGVVLFDWFNRAAKNSEV